MSDYGARERRRLLKQRRSMYGDLLKVVLLAAIFVIVARLDEIDRQGEAAQRNAPMAQGDRT